MISILMKSSQGCGDSIPTKTVNVNTRPIKLGRADITPVIRQYYQPPVKQQTGVHLLSIHKPAFSRINRSD